MSYPFMRHLAAFALLAGLVALSEPALGQGARVGARLGLTSSTINGGDAHFFVTANFSRDDRIESLQGFEGTLFLRGPLSSTLALQPEIGYARRGAQHVLRDFGGRSEIEYRFGYVQAALLLKLHVAGDAPAGFALNVGPYAGFMATREVAFEQERFDGEVNTGSTDRLDTVRDADFGLIFGADVMIASRLVLDVRYALGLRDFVNEDELNSLARSQHTGLRNSALVVGIGIVL